MDGAEMRDDGGPAESRSGGDEARLDNGLRAPRYVPLTDVDPATGRHLLTALGRARIAAYLVSAPDDVSRRLFVAAEERGDARTIVAAAVRALGDTAPVDEQADPLTGVDTDAAFDALVADWHVDTIAAVRSAERDLNQEDSDWRTRLSDPRATDEVWLDDDHYVPPPPPPLPRLARPTVLGFVVLVTSILMLVFGTDLGFADNFTLVLGIGGLVVAAGIFFSRVRDHHREEDDDGSAI